jgi:hypothetical protein
VGDGDCTTRLENTHGTEFRELLYRWHPWFGLRIDVHEAIERPDGRVFRCTVSGSNEDRWLELQAWMFDRSACAKVRLTTDARADLSALATLGALLRDVRNDRSAASDALDSGVSSLSRDQNRGEGHATPKQQTPANRRVPQQIELFVGDMPTTIGSMPAWSGLPTGTQAALTNLMTR